MDPISGRLSIRLLGPLEVEIAGQPIVVDTRKALAIVALVAGEARPFARDELAAMFWPEADDAHARGALRRTLSALRAAVGASGLLITRAQVGLDPAAARVDLTELERLAGSDRPAELEAAAVLARGPFMAGFALRGSPEFDDWQASRTVGVQRTVADLLDRLAVSRGDSGDLAGAVDAAHRRVALDPLDELGQRRLIARLARAGDRAGAIRQYRQLVALFDRELGVTPLHETTQLYDAVREGRLGSADDSAVIPAAHVIGARSDTGDQPISFPLVGRDAELSRIDRVWRASTPVGATVLLEGEAGIGKTRLAEAIAASVREIGGVVLAARGYPGEAAIAYGPIAELLRAGLARPDGATRLEALDATARSEIGRLVDLPIGLRVGGAGAVTIDRPSARVRLLDAIATALTALTTGSAPGLVWVDDLHLADDPTREALAYLARRLAGRPLLLLVAWRREDLTPAGRQTAEELSRVSGVTGVTLRRLDREEVGRLVRAIRPASAVDDALIDAFAADSEGLPLYVVAALASGLPPGVAMPRGIEVLLGERIESVGETASQILSAAAVIGRSFDLSTVRQTSGRSEEETVDAIEELTRRGIVRDVATLAGSAVRYDFSHGRMREAAYQRTSLARRRLLHRRTAEALRGEPPGRDRDDLTRITLIAGHERDAGRPSEAAEAFIEAADRAEAVFANREAIDDLESALALGYHAAARTHARIGELHARLGQYPAAIIALETAAALVGSDDLPGIELALGRVHRRRGDLTAASSHLANALASPVLRADIRARILVEESLIGLRGGDLERAGQAATEARDIAAVVDEPHLVGLTERLVGLVALGRGDLATARTALERSGAIAIDDPDPTASIAATTAIALTQAADGSTDDAVSTATAAIKLCRRIGDRHLEAAIENHLADILHEAGRNDGSMVHLKRAVALFADIGEAAPGGDAGIWTLAAW